MSPGIEKLTYRKLYGIFTIWLQQNQNPAQFYSFFHEIIPVIGEYKKWQAKKCSRY